MLTFVCNGGEATGAGASQFGRKPDLSGVWNSSGLGNPEPPGLLAWEQPMAGHRRVLQAAIGTQASSLLVCLL